jgi:hypothetical protein
MKHENIKNRHVHLAKRLGTIERLAAGFPLQYADVLLDVDAD